MPPFGGDDYASGIYWLSTAWWLFGPHVAVRGRAATGRSSWIFLWLEFCLRSLGQDIHGRSGERPKGSESICPTRVR